MGAPLDSPTIIAVCTPSGPGGVGLIRLSGADALGIARKLFAARPRLGHHVRHVSHGRIIDEDGAPIDTALAWYLVAPSTYTGEDTVEISTHGSPAVMEFVIGRGIELGARMAEPGEFTKRAFLNGKIDLLQAEAVADVIQAQSLGSLETAYGVLDGGLSYRVGQMRESLVDALSRLEAMMDFSDDVAPHEVGNIARSIARVESEAGSLVDSFRSARARLIGFRVVLVGQPNAGKSTLFNRLLGEERSIVTEVPGTTRDWVEGVVTWSGETIRLIDTAGLRDTEDVVEEAGVERTLEQEKSADVVLHIVDVSDLGLPGVLAGLEETPGRIEVGSKGDLQASNRGASEAGLLVLSAHTGEGIEELRTRILTEVTSARLENGSGPVRERHRELLLALRGATQRAGETALQENTWELAAAELQDGLRQIGELLGDGAEDAVLDRIFSEFCIGK